MEEYPYYIYPYVMQLRYGTHSEEERQALIRKVAANVGDIPSLRIMLGIDPEEFATFYPDLAYSTPTTLDTIDNFLNRFGGDINSSDDDTVESLLNEEIIEEKEDNPEKTAAKLIKNRQYQDALEIISGLNLNNPEKSVYFAHQIRFLKKLLLNEAYKRENIEN